MLPVLFVAFLVVPIVELAVLIRVGQTFGLGPTLLAVVAVSVAGAWLAKQQGLGVLRRIRGQIDAGRLPGPELVDGAIILVAGALLLTPGFVTDAVALLLLLPPVRTFIRRRLRRFFARRLGIRVHGRRVQARDEPPLP